MSKTITLTVFYRTLNVEGLEIFYREAGPRVIRGLRPVYLVPDELRVNWRNQLAKPGHCTFLTGF